MPEDDPAIRNYPEESEPMPEPVKQPVVVVPASSADPPVVEPVVVPVDEFANLTPEELKAALKSTRGEAADRRREATELKQKLAAKEKEEQEAKDKQLAEEGKFKELADQREQQLKQQRLDFNTRLINERLRAVAREAGLVDLDLIDKIPHEGITVDENGNITGVEAAVDGYKKAKPVLFKAPEVPIVETGHQPPASTVTTVPSGEIDVRKMTAKEYADYKASQRPEWRKALGGTGRVTSAV